MKTAFLLLGLAVVALSPAQAQVFRPHSFGYGHRGGWHGSSYGWGHGHFSSGPRWSVNLGFGPSYYGAYRAPVYYYDSGYYDSGYDYAPAYTYAQPSYTASGTWLGAIAGAIIGNNSGSLGHNAWRGAAYGAGLGYIFGAVADNNAARARASAAAQANASVVIAAPAPAAPAATAVTPAANPQQPITIINNYYNGATPPMSQANGLFGR
jgi:hypothetical protein